ncbi:hypothetical protein F4604DRAFT_1933373 [Suillus subluteus]|nr:hypothetical protein F4604DRAFT_1933373 [Suillus subluteus]
MQQKDNEEPSYPEHTEDLEEIHCSGVQQVIITAIRTTDLTLGFRRNPAGFHVVVKTDGTEFQTSNKPVHVDQVVVEWTEPILLMQSSRDLDQSINHFERALELCLMDHPYHPAALLNLATAKFLHLAIALLSRFMKRRIQTDADAAKELLSEVLNSSFALALHPVGHTDRSSSLNNLANRLFSRFSHRGNDEDLDQAITLQREALALHPVGHTDQSSSLNNLATQLSSHFSHRGNNEDLDQAITLSREALALRPVGHTDWSLPLETSASSSINLLRMIEKQPQELIAVEEIRKIEGFSRFLLPPLFSNLQDAARDGPIIVLITSKLSCDAIVIPHKQAPTKIPLPTNLEKLRTLAARLQCRSTPALTTALAELWDDIVHLVVENLGGFARSGS